MTRQTDTDWIAEGVPVAEYDGQYMDDHVTFTSVARLTATQIVCDNGNRYRRDNLRQVSGRMELRHPADPRVRNCVARRTLSSLRYNIDRMCKDHDGRLAEVLATLDEIEEAVRTARVSIEDAAGTARVAEGK